MNDSRTQITIKLPPGLTKALRVAAVELVLSHSKLAEVAISGYIESKMEDLSPEVRKMVDRYRKADRLLMGEELL